MLFGETLRVAQQSIRANLFRAALTMLCIVIGVAAVITMLAAGSGAQRAVEEQIEALGANVLSISAQSWFLRGVSRQQLTLEVEDVWALEEKSKYIDLVVPSLEDRGQIEYGEMFTRADDESKQRVAVLGGAIPQQLELDDPGEIVGQQVAIRGVPFTIIGVLAEVGSSRNIPDERVLMPLRTAESRVLGSEDLNEISVRIADGVPPEVAMVDIERVLRTEHRILP